MKKLPKQLTIRGVDYIITLKNNLSLNDVGVMGIINSDTGTIVLEKDAPLKMQWRTLLHEIVHAILRGYQGQDADNDEFFVDIVAGEIYMLLKQIGAL